ncbi:MAG: hypothetical protein HRU70_01080 [Phycisphaeraceae bacterium]|nr:MAG: hypothetical protein HRU70_01080 [Phycisphaeraceae bacterium]
MKRPDPALKGEVGPYARTKDRINRQTIALILIPIVLCGAALGLSIYLRVTGRLPPPSADMLFWGAVVSAGVIVVVVPLTTVARLMRASADNRAGMSRALRGVGLEINTKPTKEEKERYFRGFGKDGAIKGAAKGIVWGCEGTVDGSPLRVFRHKHVVNAGTNAAHVVDQQVAATDCPPQWPLLRAWRPGTNLERWLRGVWLIKSVAGEKPTLENETFNEAFAVSCDDMGFAELVLSPEVQARLLTLPAGVWVSLGNGIAAVIAKGEWDATFTERLAREPSALLGMLPEELWSWTPSDVPEIPNENGPT